MSRTTMYSRTELGLILTVEGASDEVNGLRRSFL